MMNILYLVDVATTSELLKIGIQLLIYDMRDIRICWMNDSEMLETA